MTSLDDWEGGILVSGREGVMTELLLLDPMGDPMEDSTDDESCLDSPS
jgi:hypothetical protein